MKVEHAGIPLATPWRRRQMEWQREREMELPVAVGHGVVHLFLLEELRDGQQLFQHVLRRHSWRMFYAPDTVRTGENRSVCLLWKKKKVYVCFSSTHLLCSSLVAQGAEFIRVSSTDLVQGSEVSGQIGPKVLWSIRQVRDILEEPGRTHYTFKNEVTSGGVQFVVYINK